MLSCRDHHSRGVLSPVGRQVLPRYLRLILLLRRPWLVVSWYFFISFSRPSIISDLISRRDRKSPPQSLTCASTIDGSSEKIPSCRANLPARRIISRAKYPSPTFDGTTPSASKKVAAFV